MMTKELHKDLQKYLKVINNTDDLSNFDKALCRNAAIETWWMGIHQYIQKKGHLLSADISKEAKSKDQAQFAQDLAAIKKDIFGK